MPILFCDSFDHYPSTDLSKKYDSVANCYISSTKYRTGGYSLTSNQGGFYVSKNIVGTLVSDTSTSAGPDFFYGAHYYLSFLDGQPLLQITGTLTYQLQVEASGSLKLVKTSPAPNEVVVGTYPGLISLFTWHHIFLRGNEIYVDGKASVDHNVWESYYQTPSPSTNIRIYPGGVVGNSAYVDNVYFGAWATSEAGDTFIEDEESGYIHRPWMINRRYSVLDASVEVVLPVEDYTTEWTPLTGSDNYAMVDDVYQDGDTSYNYTTLSGNVDLFSYQTVTGSGRLHGVQLVYLIKDENTTVTSGLFWPVVVSPDVIPDTGEEWVPFIARGQEDYTPTTPWIAPASYSYRTAFMTYKCEPEYEEPGIGLGGWYGGMYIPYSGWTIDSFNASHFGYGMAPSGMSLSDPFSAADWR